MSRVNPVKRCQEHCSECGSHCGFVTGHGGKHCCRGCGFNWKEKKDRKTRAVYTNPLAPHNCFCGFTGLLVRVCKICSQPCHCKETTS